MRQFTSLASLEMRTVVFLPLQSIVRITQVNVDKALPTVPGTQ